MRETYFFKSKRIWAATINDATEIVKQNYDGITAVEGSLGHYTWYIEKTIVAEAWLCGRRKSGWWLKIKPVN
ncbi:MAG TPA: hypothetical protein VK203_06205 [Nostocaceae cyanobacterium]|nr:hypothetical protein [Nostocaceae cyanobacterium]